MCSFGSRILPRPGDSHLCYVGGETRVVSFLWAVASFATLVAALAKVAPALFALELPRSSLKHLVPRDDLDSLISASPDNDIADELDRLHYEAAAAAAAAVARLLRLMPRAD